jgi:hypothetical protein
MEKVITREKRENEKTPSAIPSFLEKAAGGYAKQVRRKAESKVIGSGADSPAYIIGEANSRKNPDRN